MNKYTIELKNKDGELEEVSFRLLSDACMEIEEKEGKSLIEYVQNENVTMIVNMLGYMRKFDNSAFSKLDAKRLYDRLIDNGWTYKEIITDLIYETLVVSGFLTKEELEIIKKETEEMKKLIEMKQKEALQNI